MTIPAGEIERLPRLRHMIWRQGCTHDLPGEEHEKRVINSGAIRYNTRTKKRILSLPSPSCGEDLVGFLLTEVHRIAGIRAVVIRSVVVRIAPLNEKGGKYS